MHDGETRIAMGVHARRRDNVAVRAEEPGRRGRPKHKVTRAVMRREEPHQLNDFVQVDDAYLGGARNGGDPGAVQRTGRPS